MKTFWIAVIGSALLLGGCAGRAPLVREAPAVPPSQTGKAVATKGYCPPGQTCTGGKPAAKPLPPSVSKELEEMRREIVALKNKLAGLSTKEELRIALTNLEAKLAKAPTNSQELAELRTWTIAQIQRLNETEAIIRTEHPDTRVSRLASFDTDSSVLTALQKKGLDDVAKDYITNGRIVKAIFAWADVRADEAYNVRLSKARAEAVRAYLVSKKVQMAKDVSINGEGETDKFSFVQYKPNRTILVVHQTPG